MLSRRIREIIQCVDVLQGEDGGVNCSLENLTLQEISVGFDPKTLGEFLPIFGTPEEIIKTHQTAKEHPEVMQSERDDSDPRVHKKLDQAAGACQCRACKAKKDQEDR